MKSRSTAAGRNPAKNPASSAGWKWEPIAFVLILLVASALRLWRLDQNGFGNTYYAAAVRSMMQSWHNFFFASFDPGGYITVDKPPVALWAQVAFAKLLGYKGINLLLPQALAGMASVAIIYAMVRRIFVASAGLIAALVLAVTPISVAMDRTNNLDTLLALTLLLAAWTLVRAAETGRLSLLLASAALVGIGFNIKMMAAFIVVPTFALVYILGAPVGWKKRLAHLVGAALVLAVVSMSWAVVVDMIPASERPFVGGTQNSSEVELILGYNGLGRITGQEGNFAGGSGGPGGFPGGRNAAGGFPPMAGGGNPPGNGGMRQGFGGTPGLFRLANEQMADQITWLFPLAAVGLICAASLIRRKWPVDSRALALILWTGLLVTHCIVFSFARGIIHEYYLVALGPSLAALVGIGVVSLWSEYLKDGWRSYLLPVALLASASWQASILENYTQWSDALYPILMGSTLVATVGLIVAKLPKKRAAMWQIICVTIGMLAILMCPAGWSVTPLLSPVNGTMPTAGPNSMGGWFQSVQPGMYSIENPKLISFLKSNHGGERYILATTGVQAASQIVIDSGKPVMGIGGWSGNDPSSTVEQFAKMVSNGEVRFVMVSGMGGGPGGHSNSDIFGWVIKHGKPVDSSLWQAPDATFEGGPMRMSELYDCRPD
ncbi:MAG: glycosyltransferase family 39 protein [Armatimonadota bacterium]